MPNEALDAALRPVRGGGRALRANARGQGPRVRRGGCRRAAPRRAARPAGGARRDRAQRRRQPQEARATCPPPAVGVPGQPRVGGAFSTTFKCHRGGFPLLRPRPARLRAVLPRGVPVGGGRGPGGGRERRARLRGPDRGRAAARPGERPALPRARGRAVARRPQAPLHLGRPSDRRGRRAPARCRARRDPLQREGRRRPRAAGASDRRHAARQGLHPLGHG